MSNHNFKNAVQNFIHLLILGKTPIKQMNTVADVIKLPQGVNISGLKGKNPLVKKELKKISMVTIRKMQPCLNLR